MSSVAPAPAPLAEPALNAKPQRAVPWAVPLAINAALLTLAVVAAGAGTQLRVRFPEIRGQLTTEMPGGPVGGGAIIEGWDDDPYVPESFVYRPWLLPTILTVLALAIVAFVAWRLWKRRGALRTPTLADDGIVDGDLATSQLDQAELLDAVTVAQNRMDEARNPSDAVVAGWLAFEDSAATRGFVREQHETTTEFTARLLEASNVPTAPLGVLRSLYQQVRFGGREPDALAISQARAALGEIADNIRAMPTPTAAPLQPKTERAYATPIATGVTRNKWGEE
ncbi:MAG: DUF4129 domain-containing protein [Cellulomonadaceae bacterium]|jgi:hypothetical protein|nr:DUF4129 domain-containing protein [Cellulomonadaceae bacterium]